MIATLTSTALVCSLSVGSILHGHNWEAPIPIDEACNLMANVTAEEIPSVTLVTPGSFINGFVFV